MQIIGTALTKDAISVNDISRDKPVVLVLGSEGQGIRSMVLKQCTQTVKIVGGAETGFDEQGLDSLNVSVSGGILLYALLRNSMHK
jgi:tRNA G18 (ribose-2'-O)-methylase SpoU